jgi:hypothetical protein
LVAAFLAAGRLRATALRAVVFFATATVPPVGHNPSCDRFVTYNCDRKITNV